MKLLKFTLLFLFLSFSIIVKAQIETYYVKPIDTNPGYDAAEDSSAISVNIGNQINKLFLFFVGSWSSSSTGYHAIRQHAAGLGYDVINLSYPNDVAAASLADNSDSMAFNNYREELCFGTSVSNDVDVDSLNSIYTRTLNLIQYLALTYPTQNWGQYLASPTTLDWSKIAVGGHSQGSGHACYLAKQFEVDRVLMFAGPNDYSDYYSNSANWLRQPGITPLNRHYSYLSLNDETVVYSKQLVNITGLGMLTNDDTTFVDNAQAPYENSHCLYTTQSPGFAIINHNVPVKYSLINNDVWTYMLTAFSDLSVQQLETENILTLFPNPATSKLKFRTSDFECDQPYIISNQYGQVVLEGKINEYEYQEIDITSFTPGVYFFQLANSSAKFVKIEQ